MSYIVDADPAIYDAASKVFGQSMANGVQAAWNALTGSLSPTAQMAGSDGAGTSWSAQYDPAAQDTISLISDLENACIQIAAMLEQTGFNHGMAEAHSDPTRSVPTPADKTAYVAASPGYGSCVAGHDVPLAAGGTTSQPTGWSILEHAIGYLWPNGDTGKLRDASQAWATAANNLDDVAYYVPEAVEGISLQQSPEVDDAVTVCQSMATHLNDTAGNCRILSRACSDLADHIDTAHGAIEGEIKSFLEWSAGIEFVGGALSFFSFGAAEVPTQGVEAGRIAATGARIAELCRTLISAAKTVADTVVDVFGKLAETAGKLKLILGAKLSEVVTSLAARFGLAAKGAEATAEADLASASRIGSLDFSTGKDQAFFWSGRTDGVGGASVAADRAGAGGGGGKTLEQIMEERGITMPEWNPDDPSSIAAWDQASEQYANGASGTVRAVIGDSARPGNTWQTVELPALENNPAVTKIIQIDPKTGIEKVLWTR